MIPRSPFLNLGLWTACFNLFRHPKVQFDHIYHGCYSVLGDDFRMIVYWMVPGGSSLSFYQSINIMSRNKSNF